MDVFKRDNGPLRAAPRDNHRHCQGACICAEEGRTEPLTFLENSWVIIPQLDLPTPAAHLPKRRMERDLC